VTLRRSPGARLAGLLTPLLLGPALLGAQPGEEVDSLGVPYPYAAFVAKVLVDHPIARQAELVAEDARNQLRTAWGAFDPTVSSTWDQKRFKGTGYYAYTDVAVKIPTPLGSDIKLGFERAAGEFINPDRNTPGVGLFTAGFTIPLGQRIITDERRTALKQAQAARDAGEAERVSMINALLLNAARAYGTWYEAWRRLQIASEGVELAQFRLDAVQESVRNGVSPPVDTLEASLEVQRREIARREAAASYFTAEVTLTAFLWDSNGEPVGLAPAVRPSLEGLEAETIPAADSVAIANWLATATTANPRLRKIEADVQSAQAARLLNAQQLIPFAEAGVFAISERGDTPPLLDRDQAQDNFKGTIEIRSPLLYLKERGRLGSAGARLDIRRAERDRLEREVDNAIRIAANDLDVLRNLLALQERNVAGVRLLRDAEALRFANGESTLLVVNLRERAVLDEEVRLAQYQARVAAARASLAVAIGDVTTLPGVLGRR
jgi:outer membrane protein TolC